jgi:hypothetical protein
MYLNRYVAVTLMLSVREFELFPHVTGAALGGLMAVWVAASCPEDAGEEDADDDEYDDEWGSDVHGVQSLTIQIIRGQLGVCGCQTPVSGRVKGCGFMMNPPVFCS